MKFFNRGKFLISFIGNIVWFIHLCQKLLKEMQL
jgi:hypothetical protein